VPFFTFETSEGWAPLTKDWFMGRCNEIRKQLDMRALTAWLLDWRATELALRVHLLISLWYKVDGIHIVCLFCIEED